MTTHGYRLFLSAFVILFVLVPESTSSARQSYSASIPVRDISPWYSSESLKSIQTFQTKQDSNAPTGSDEDSFIFLPVAVRSFPFIPDSPVLNEIGNQDGDGNYTVSWSASEGADTYNLQEDDNPGFSSPSTVYSGSDTSTSIKGRVMGEYFYRVRASSASATSIWSNIESVAVTTGSLDYPKAGAWSGATSQSAAYYFQFTVKDSPEYVISSGSLKVYIYDSCYEYRELVFNLDVPIVNNHFDTGGQTDPKGAYSWVKGDFTSSFDASGTFYFQYLSCTASGSWSATILGANKTIETLALQPDGKILLGGVFGILSGDKRSYIGRINPDATLDASFTPALDNYVHALALQPDGKILLGGDFMTVNGQTRRSIARLNPDGSLDTTFIPPTLYGNVKTVILQDDGKILIGGNFTGSGVTYWAKIARLNADGSRDESFTLSANNTVDAIVFQADGKIIVAGAFTKIGGQTHNHIARLNPDGTLDADFNPSIQGPSGFSVYSVALQADGKILVGGNFTQVEGTSRKGIACLNPDGSLDTAFDPAVETNGFGVLTIAVQADHKILIGGFFTQIDGQTRDNIGRLNPDGSLDIAFDPGANLTVEKLKLQADGKILVAGAFSTLAGQVRLRIGRLNPDGTIDETFP